MTPTIETVAARLDHAITVIEVMASRVESMDAHWEHRLAGVTVRERALSDLARRLGGAAFSIAAARIIPKGRWLLATSLGAFTGGIVGAMVWQWLHAASAFAHP